MRRCTAILSVASIGRRRSYSPSRARCSPAIFSIDRNRCSAMSVHLFLVRAALDTSATDRNSSRRTHYRVRSISNTRTAARYASYIPYIATRSDLFRALRGRSMSH